jgi:hypothetical protein
MNFFLASLKRLNWKIFLTCSCIENYVLDIKDKVTPKEAYVALRGPGG